MRGKLKLIFMALLSLLPLSLNAAEDGGGLDMKSYIFGHVGDAYEWHITKVGDTDISIPLPCIVVDDGLHVFSSKRM